MSSQHDLPPGFGAKVRDTCFCFHVQRAARAVARHFDEALRPVGLTNGQFSLMISLNRGEARRLGAISTALAMDRTTLTANLKPLVRRGLVRVSVDETDRRIRLLTLTSAGRRLLVAAVPLWTRAQAETARLVAASGPDRVLADLRALS